MKKNWINKDYTTFIPILGAILGVLIARGTYIDSKLDDKKKAESMYENREIKDKLINVQKDINNLSIRLENIEYAGDTSNTPLRLEIQSVKSSIKEIGGKLDNLEEVILKDPVKALEIQFLKKDIETMKESIKSDQESVQQDIDKINSLVLGSIVALVIAIITPLIQNIINYRKQQKHTGAE